MNPLFSANAFKALGVAFDLGASMRGASLGPEALWLTNQGRIPALTAMEFVRDLAPVDGHFDKARNLASYSKACAKVFTQLSKILHDGFKPLLVTGDHSIGYAGVAAASNHCKGTLGVVWIDAHGDIHTPETSDSGNIHGMPLALATDRPLSKEFRAENPDLASFWDALVKLGKPVLTENLVYIGIRDTQPAEDEWLESGASTLIRTLEQSGQEMGHQALNQLTGCEQIYVSFDIDAMDPSCAQGTGYHVPGGLSPDQLSGLLQVLLSSPKLAGFEISELNPLRDVRNATCHQIINLLSQTQTA